MIQLGLGLGLFRGAGGVRGPIASLSCDATGVTLTLVWPDAMTVTGSGQTVLTVNGSAAGIDSGLTTGDTTTFVYDLSLTQVKLIQLGDEVTLSMDADTVRTVSGNVPNEAITDSPVANDSTVIPITLGSATVDSATKVLCVYSGAVTVGGTSTYKVDGVTASGATQAGTRTAGVVFPSPVATAGAKLTVPFRDATATNGQGAYVQAGQVVIS